MTQVPINPTAIKEPRAEGSCRGTRGSVPPQGGPDVVPRNRGVHARGDELW